MLPAIPPQLRAELAQKILYLDGKPFTLADYPFFVDIYNGDHQGVLMKCGRQVAKSVQQDAKVLLANGAYCTIRDLHIGDVVVTLADDGVTIGTACVTWKSNRYTKPCRRIRTRLGHTINIATTHPIRTWETWTEAAALRKGDRIATIRRGGVFTGTHTTSEARIRTTAYLIGDGHISKNISLTTLPGLKAQEFIRDVHAAGGTCAISVKHKSKAFAIRVHRNTAIQAWMAEDGLIGTKSKTKFIPEWVFNLSRNDTALFLNRLWSTDGSAKQPQKTQFAFTYASISKQLIRQVQALLWKFGIPTACRRSIPAIYKRRNQRKYAYQLRIETLEGVQTFLTEIGALEKTILLDVPQHTPNNNRDTYPLEINDLIRKVVASRKDHRRFGCRADKGKSLRTAGLRETLKNAPTKEKITDYLRFFRRDVRYGADEVQELAKHLDTRDVYWDRIVDIRNLGERPCYDIEVEGTHNFIVEGVVTHNSTTLCNFIICESIGIPHFRNLYISPSQEQTQTFSNTRIGKTCYYSPLVRKYWTATDFTHRTMLRMFRNGAEVKFTYAMDNPDRARGNTADRVNFDEVQDMLYEEVIPVINECMANSNYGYETYAGTPKTMENTIEYLWGISTQNEWIMKCEGCGKWSFIDSHKALGKTGPVCVGCDHNLNPRHGQWYSFNPGSTLVGFHISQPMLPLNRENPARWRRLLNKLERYSDTKFKNEVLGISDAIGARLISKPELEALCGSYDVYRVPPTGQKDYSHIVAGIDWSGGGTQGVSRTVVWIWGVTKEHRLKTLYFRIYPVTNPVSVLDDIVDILTNHNVELVVGDRGEGHLANNLLAQRLGKHRVAQAQYGSQSRPLMWNDEGGFYTVDRTCLMDNYFMVLKRQGVIYPRLGIMQDPIEDVLNIYEEITKMGKKVWRHAPTKPDDCFHAQLFGWLAAKIVLMDLEFNG